MNCAKKAIVCGPLLRMKLPKIVQLNEEVIKGQINELVGAV
ncbi:hypothetical protein SDC9_22082 [bioreactor metagenome]|uniref:Uncharacterized protein n=1 Tax=bioreactor metagenome TaxID=1076179 RepID=A0A644UBE7_9ZZZZ|nr:hypothetical protein [Desulfitobacterium hafniense]MEA5022112.1 hypothetical protein [Desulfitobacterium hafniense]